MEWITHYWETLTWTKIIWGAVAILISTALGYGAVILVMVKIPYDYFSSSYNQDHRNERHFFVRWGATIFKNIIGALLIVAGLIMILGPGPGVLTILLGLIMLDIPGKRPLEAKLIARPPVLAAINNLRSKYNKPPLLVD